ncbi:unnamed protein product, partial [Amoebophrya sp. A120]
SSSLWSSAAASSASPTSTSMEVDEEVDQHRHDRGGQPPSRIRDRVRDFKKNRSMNTMSTSDFGESVELSSSRTLSLVQRMEALQIRADGEDTTSKTHEMKGRDTDENIQEDTTRTTEAETG